MADKATSVNNQIKKLIKRGMIITDINKAKEILTDIGYYKLGFYWNKFEDKSLDDHIFISNVYFDDVVKLYYLDLDLRHLLLKYLYRIEINFRTKIIYYGSNFYKNDPQWYLNDKYIDIQFINYFKKYIYTKNFKKENVAIKNHINKYGAAKHPPAWKVMEYFTLGHVIKLYESIKNDELKDIIFNSTKFSGKETLKNYMNGLKFIRNICSHSGVLYDCQQHSALSDLPTNFLKDGDVFDKRNLFSSIKVIEFCISLISENRQKELNERLENLFDKNKHNDIMIQIIENHIGYNY